MRLVSSRGSHGISKRSPECRCGRHIDLPAGGGGFGLGRVFLKEGQPEPPATTDYEANWNVVTPDYFRTLGIPLVRGRTSPIANGVEPAGDYRQ